MIEVVMLDGDIHLPADPRSEIIDHLARLFCKQDEMKADDCLALRIWDLLNSSLERALIQRY